MYCTNQDVINLLPATVSVGDLNLGTPTPGRPTTKRSTLTPDEVIYYIRYASQVIDSRLRPFYFCPLRRVKQYETEVLNNVNPGLNVTVYVHDSGPFAKGDLVRLQNTTGYESCSVSDIPTDNLTYLKLATVVGTYNSSNSIISILKYPDPIPTINARLAISYAFDQLFSAEQSPDISQYGVNQRTLAQNDMDSILSGTILLFGQDQSGRRFIRSTLYDAPKSPVKDFQFGREKAS